VAACHALLQSIQYRDPITQTNPVDSDLVTFSHFNLLIIWLLGINEYTAGMGYIWYLCGI
jgi:hypothetical protein